MSNSATQFSTLKFEANTAYKALDTEKHTIASKESTSPSSSPKISSARNQNLVLEFDANEISSSVEITYLSSQRRQEVG